MRVFYWFPGMFLKLLVFILLSDFGILVVFSVNSQKHHSRKPNCSVKLGQYLRSHRVEFSLRKSKLIQSEGQQRKSLDITSLVLISLLVTARPSSYGSACPSHVKHQLNNRQNVLLSLKNSCEYQNISSVEQHCCCKTGAGWPIRGRPGCDKEGN